MAKDPYRYFRIEARELVDGLSRGVLEIEKSSGRETIANMLRLAHTLKGASRVVKQTGIADLAHEIEDRLGPYREQDGPIAERVASELLRLLDAISEELQALDGNNGSTRSTGRVRSSAEDDSREDRIAAGTQAAAAEELLETIRVDVGELDALLGEAEEASAELAGLRRLVDSADRTRQVASFLSEGLAARGVTDGARGATDAARGATDGDVREGTANGLNRLSALSEELRASLQSLLPRIADGIERVGRELRSVRDSASRLRLAPARAIFPSLERAARDAAESLKKSVEWSASGGEHRIDGNVLFATRDALLHVVRNAVVHGIEEDAVRSRSGKPRVGRVRLRVERRGSRVVFTCSDDGRGVDVDQVRNAAVSRGLLSRVDASVLDPEQALDLVWRAGLSTQGEVTAMAGRGIGLDVVRGVMSSLRGEASLRSRRGEGTEIELSVPVSLSSLSALLVEAGGVDAAIPLDAVRKTVRIEPTEIARSSEGESLLYDGRAIAYLELRPLLSRRDPRAGDGTGPRVAVVVEANGMLAAIAVERLLGTAEIVVRALPPPVAATSLIAGAALDTGSALELVLNPDALVEAARTRRASGDPVDPMPRRPLLVIDDSLTTRMLEQSILESAGYHVDLATSAEEAFQKARAKSYGLFLVDVEMPGMDGFEFVRRTRSDPFLSDIPSILVTSRGTPEDRQKGADAGAAAYMVKSEFDQRRLLETIRELMGRAT